MTMFRMRFGVVGLVLVAALISGGAFVAYPAMLHANESTDATAARRAELTRQLNELNTQISTNQAIVDKLASEGKSLSSEVQTLNAQIKKSQLQIQATQVGIRQLDGNITVHARTIGTLTNKLTAERESLGQILRNTDQFDDYSLIEIALSSDSFSDFFSSVDAYTNLKVALGESYDRISSTRAKTTAEKQALEEQRVTQSKLAELQTMVKQKVQEQQSTKNKLLTSTKGQESAYRAVVATQKKTAAQIQAELFGLAGGGGAIPFGTALEYAKTASRLTGVRPALILAILSQESALGKNTGQCLVTDLATGDGKGKNSGTPFTGVMKAPRDTVVFERIMNALGREWSTTAVSCPIASAGGYGGAMGPTQFIPSTWVQIEGKLKALLGISATDPWNNLHAITATGIYLANVGAAGGSAQAEAEAAGAYYAGWGGRLSTNGKIYASNVLEKARKFQADIDTIGN